MIFELYNIMIRLTMSIVAALNSNVVVEMRFTTVGYVLVCWFVYGLGVRSLPPPKCEGLSEIRCYFKIVVCTY